MLFEEAPERGADEIYCPSCSSAIGRGLAVCPQCGKGVPFELQGVSEGDMRQFRQPVRQPIGQPATSTPEQDVVGAGRYIINFIIAQIPGLIITFLLRRHGWLATWVCVAWVILGVALLLWLDPTGARLIDVNQGGP